MELRNRSATYEYYIEDKLTAGIVLTGTEIKSIREGRVSFNDSFCYFNEGELFVKSLHIAAYSHGTYANHDPLRERKLLLQKRELRKWENKLKDKGYTIIPLRVFISGSGLAKIEIGLARGKKLYDKRESIRQRETMREVRRNFKR